MATSIEFSDDAIRLLGILKEKYRVKTTRAVLEKALKISAILAEEQDESGAVIIQGKDKIKTRLIIS
jgi:hypothetical protein